jgi:hypothetical protein
LPAASPRKIPQPGAGLSSSKIASHKPVLAKGIEIWAGAAVLAAVNSIEPSASRFNAAPSGSSLFHSAAAG